MGKKASVPDNKTLAFAKLKNYAVLPILQTTKSQTVNQKPIFL